MNLKDIFASDIDDVFLDNGECAENCVLVIEGAAYNIPVIISGEETTPISKMLDGVYQSDLVIAFKAAAVGRVPVRGQLLTLNGKTYQVAKVSNEKGLLIVKLEVADI